MPGALSVLKRLQLEEGWGTFWLTLALLVSAAWAVAAAGWVPGLWMLPTIAVGAAFAGLALAKSRFSGGTAAVFAVAYGLFWNGLIIGRSLPDMLIWRDRILELANRTAAWAMAAFTGGTSRDPLMFVIFMGAVFWALAISALWSIFRADRVWPAIVPPGVVVLANVLYHLEPSRLQIYLATYMLLALLLIARTNLVARERLWRQSHVSYSSDIHYDFFRAGLATAAVLLMLAWAVPSVEANEHVVDAWNRATGAWSEVRKFFNRSFTAATGYRLGPNDFYGDSLVLSGAVRLSDKTYLEIRTSRRVPRFYWRARVFDRYADGQWTSTDADVVLIGPDDEALRFPRFAERTEINVEVTSFFPAAATLYVPPQPVWISRPARLGLSFDPEGQADISIVRPQTLLASGDDYQVLSSVATPSEASLRAAGAQYPEWLAERYLQLPPTITDRTRQLAAEVTADATTPYDAALAIQNYLREAIAYNQLIAAPPPEVEPVDYLLFERPEGYCNYYATAMVVMLRSLGIPARMAVGFAQGEYVSEAEAFRVRESDAHAWPEVYFPRYGWVEFEPTVSQAPIQRPAVPATASSGGNGGAPGEEDFERGTGNRDRDSRLPEEEALGDAVGAANAAWWASVPLESVAGALAGLLLGIGLIAGWWALESRGLGGLSPSAAAYGRLGRAAEWLGLRLTAALTPHERAAQIARTLPAAPVNTITDLYVAERFGAHPPDRGEEAQAAWRGLRLHVWLGATRAVLDRWREPDPDERWQRLQRRMAQGQRSAAN